MLVKQPLPVIVQGSDRDLEIRLRAQSTGDPIDLSGATEITAQFKNTDGTIQNYALSTGGIQILSGLGGRLQVHLPASGTTLLQTTVPDATPPYQGVEVGYIVLGKKTIVNIPESIDVQARLY